MEKLTKDINLGNCIVSFEKKVYTKKRLEGRKRLLLDEKEININEGNTRIV